MSNVNRILNMLEDKTENLSSYEAHQLVNHYMEQGYSYKDAQRLSLRSFADSSKVAFQGVPGPMPTVSKSPVSAQVNIVIDRPTANLNNALTIPIFGFQDSMSVYQGLVTPQANQSFGLAGGLYGGLGLVVPNSAYFFSYWLTATPATRDTLNVSCNEIQYPSFISATATDVFRLSKIRYSINDTSTAGLAQFTNAIKVVKRNMFGRYEQQNLSVQSQKNPNQFQTGIIDLDYTIDIDKETTLLVDVAAVAGLKVTLSAFVTKFERRAAGL